MLSKRIQSGEKITKSGHTRWVSLDTFALDSAWCLVVNFTHCHFVPCGIYTLPFCALYIDMSASHEYLCTLVQNGHEFCKLLIKRPQTVMFSNYI